ncbi:MAG: response regulator transcription factor [FCB group bacterium]|nr:response regulator transcription factor [FCB group bacterium]MBL7028549.1 response regulator transcription factor [Candidatus Neomarinimicrobiota bacterium]MBL7120768.1 response regulator transcription factor [Candidatus Neomarinimicrobiota bacterium]
MSIRCLLVDDEPLALEALESLLTNIDDVEIIEKCTSGVEAFKILGEQKVDLLFLDIEMPEVSGLDLIRNLVDPPEVVFVTAHRDYAFDGFEQDVLDFLLKPVSLPRILKTLDRFRIQRQSLPPVINEESAQSKPAYITVHINRQSHRVALEQIHYIESYKDYIKIYTEPGTLVVRETIGGFEKRLPQDDFLRIHRSYIIPLNKVKAFDATQVDLPGKTFPLGPHYQREALARLQN